MSRQNSPKQKVERRERRALARANRPTSPITHSICRYCDHRTYLFTEGRVCIPDVYAAAASLFRAKS